MNDEFMNKASKLFELYVNCVLDGVERDFGVKKVEGEPLNTVAWFRRELGYLMEIESEDVNITNTPAFRDYDATEEGE